MGSVDFNIIEKYEQEDTERYQTIGENAVAVQEEVDKRQGEEGYALTSERDGVVISVSDVYCDGYILYYTTTLQTDREELMSADVSVPNTLLSNS